MTVFIETALRRTSCVLAFVLASTFANGAHCESFDAFVAALWKDAQSQGITRATFDTALAGVTPDERVIGAMQRQPEYGKPFGAYVELDGFSLAPIHRSAQVDAMGGHVARCRK